MRKLCIIMMGLCLGFLTQPLLGEAIQRVVIMEYIPDLQSGQENNSVKKPLARVEVQVQGASSTVTNKNGECVLKFNTLNSGDRIVPVRISRPGYEVMSPRMLGDLVIRRDNTPIVILMISQENLMKRYHHTEKMVNTQVDKQKKKELDSLDPFAKDYARRREEIERKYEAKLDDIEQYIDRLVRLDFSNLGNYEIELAEAYEAGDLEKVLEYLDRSNLIDKYREISSTLQNVKTAHSKVDRARSEHEKSMKDLHQYLQYQIALLEMEGSEESIHKAMRLLEKMLDVDAGGYYQMNEYMELALQQKEYHYIDSLLRANIKNAETNRYRFCRYSTDLATILYEQMRYDEAWDLLVEVSNLRDSLYDGSMVQRPLSVFHNMMNYHMMGRICMRREQKPEAVAYFKKSYDAYLNLRKADSETKLYAPNTYPRIHKMISYLCDMDEWALADSIFHETYPRVEELFSHGSFRERFIVVTFKMANVNIHFHRDSFEEAMRLQMEILPEMARIYALNRTLCEDSYQQILRNMAKYQYVRGNFDQMIYYADKWFTILKAMDESRKSMENLTPQMMADVMNRYTEILILYAYSLGQLGQSNRTESIYCEVIDIMEQNPELIKRVPKRLAISYANVAEMRLNKGEKESARNMAKRALELNPSSPTANDVIARLEKEESSK